MMRNKYILLSILIALTFNACKVKEKIISPKKSEVNLPKQDNNEKIKIPLPFIKSANLNKIVVEMDMQGKQFSSNAAMKIIRDSLIQISVMPALGIEMFRMEFSKNGFVAVDKINGKYFKSNYDSLYTRFKIKVDYQSIQALFLNELFLVGQTNNNTDSLISKFSSLPFPDGIMYRTKPGKVSIPTDFTLNKDNQLTYTSLTMPSAVFSCRYQDFGKDLGYTFPNTFKISIAQGPYVQKANISIKSGEINKAVKMNITDLSNYEQVTTFEQLIP